MIYKPATGRFKDTSVVWHQGQYYLFSMYSPDAGENFRNVWMAVSSDGVHWKHIGPAIKDAPFNIWAMSVYRVGDRFILNHGSFTRPGVQNVLCFWESDDLVHWTFRGHDADVTPDTRWYDPDSRLDCMSVVPVDEAGGRRYYGYATGPGGFLVSDDGLRWQGLPPPQVDWDFASPPPTTGDESGFEIGGCHAIGGRYYLVGGWFNYMGVTGYGVYTLVSDTPTGPFRADVAAYRLCGNSTRWVSLWARFIQTDTELLVNGYQYDGHSYETGAAWLPPLKRAIVDGHGHLRLGYWAGNDALKGESLAIGLDQRRIVYPGEPGKNATCELKDNGCRIEAQPERISFRRTNIPTTVTLFETPRDFNNGIVVEGVIRATCRDRRLVASSVGFYLEEAPGMGTAILLHSYGLTETGRLTLDPLTFTVEDTVGPGCASPAGLTPHVPHRFRLLARRTMFELYLDDLLVETFNTAHDPDHPGITPRRLGFIVQNGQGFFEDVQMWTMSLHEGGEWDTHHRVGQTID
ncbi:MAG: hypothetical protein PHR35_04875 [Kiritimatiellae bacterium]|nr:hypothetical protein [Kiritimatiellia bacterium]